MNELIYSFRENNVRVIMEGDTPWFVAKDVCEVLEISHHRDALSRLEEDERGSVVVDTLGGKQNLSAVNEYGIYSLIFNSRKPQAKEFKRWVTHEVIPSIRKHGLYATKDTAEKILNDPSFLIKALQTLEEERQARKKAEGTVAILTHVNKVYTTTEIAKELGLRSANALNNKLSELGIQFKQNGTWVLYSRYADKGYTQIKQNALDNGKVVYDRKWTQIGREFILNLIGGF